VFGFIVDAGIEGVRGSGIEVLRVSGKGKARAPCR